MLLDEELQNDPATYPAQQLQVKFESGLPLDAEGQRRRDTLWTDIRN
jgi:hypothetical protein